MKTGHLLQDLHTVHKENEDVMRARCRIELQCQSVCRRFTKGEKAKASALWVKVRKDPTKNKAGIYLKTLGLLDAYQLLLSNEKSTRKRLEQMAGELPILPWVESIKGLGLLSVGRIMGEIGDPCDYSGPSKIWKRMGLAVIDGERQRRCLDKVKAERHGYNPVRRAIMYVITDSLLKQKNCYKALYDERKPIELAKLPEKGDDGKKVKGRKGHAHKMAMRYAAKRMLLDLWLEWHRAVGTKAPGQPYQPAKVG